jgi:aldehyde dehydrogenase (NAD+)
MTFRTPEEAVALANNTPYGLAASVWSETSTSRSTSRPRLKERRGLDQQHEPVRCGGGLRRLSRERLRPRRWSRGHVGVRQARLERERPARGVDPVAAEGRFRRERRSPCGPTDGPPPSIVPRSSTSAVSRCAPIREYAASGACAPTAGCSEKSGAAIARTSATLSKPRVRPARWAGTSAHQRAQILYYLAENLEARGEGARGAPRRPRAIDAGRPSPSSTPRSSGCSRTRPGPTSGRAPCTPRRCVT